MSPLKLSRTTASGVTEEEVELDNATTKKVEKILADGVTLETAFKEGLDEIVRKHGNS
jgi:hypothetical protein